MMATDSSCLRSNCSVWLMASSLTLRSLTQPRLTRLAPRAGDQLVAQVRRRRLEALAVGEGGRRLQYVLVPLADLDGSDSFCRLQQPQVEVAGDQAHRLQPLAWPALRRGSG